MSVQRHPGTRSGEMCRACAVPAGEQMTVTGVCLSALGFKHYEQENFALVIIVERFGVCFSSLFLRRLLKKCLLRSEQLPGLSVIVRMGEISSSLENR